MRGDSADRASRVRSRVPRSGCGPVCPSRRAGVRTARTYALPEHLAPADPVPVGRIAVAADLSRALELAREVERTLQLRVVPTRRDEVGDDDAVDLVGVEPRLDRIRN